jgi:hypothetical protein
MENSEIIASAQRALVREGAAIAKLVGRPLENTKGISFKINENDDGVAYCLGTEITMFKKYFDPRPWDIQGAAVHEATHAIQRAPVYDNTTIWMVEGLADFVRHKLGYGIIRQGDPHKGYGEGAGFYNWMYDFAGDNQKTYYAFIAELNAGKVPANTEVLLKAYNNGSPQKDFNVAAANENKKSARAPHRKVQGPAV